jgi:hypothetical protein
MKAILQSLLIITVLFLSYKCVCGRREDFSGWGGVPAKELLKGQFRIKQNNKYIGGGDRNEQLSSTTNLDSSQWKYDAVNRRFVDVTSGKCLNINGLNGSGAYTFRYYDCADWDVQRWYYDDVTKQIKSVDKPDICVQDSPDSAGKDFYVGATCSDISSQKFEIVA